MEYQVVNEISSFWENLMLPIIMGIITIIFILWIMGGNNRNYLFDKILTDNSNKYVLSNGIYIPKKLTKGNMLRKKLKAISGFSDLKPMIIVFLIMLLMFGMHRIVLMIFLPSLTKITPNILFASGIEEYLLADIWRMHPELKDLNQVYYYIQKNSDYENNMILLFSVEAYLKLFIVIVLIMLIIKFIKKKNENGRLLIVLPVICVFLIIIYAFQIQNYNQETLDKCYNVYYQLKNEDYIENEEEIDVYVEKIRENKQQYQNDFYFGAYRIRNNEVELIKNSIKEIYRFCVKNK